MNGNVPIREWSSWSRELWWKDLSLDDRRQMAAPRNTQESKTSSGEDEDVQCTSWVEGTSEQCSRGIRQTQGKFEAEGWPGLEIWVLVWKCWVCKAKWYYLRKIGEKRYPRGEFWNSPIEGRGKLGASTRNRKTRSEMWEGKLHVPCLEKSREKHILKGVISEIRLWRGVRAWADHLAQPVRRLEISEGPISLEWWGQALGC